MLQSFREFRTLVPVIQQLFFWRPVYTEKEDLQSHHSFVALLNRSAGYPRTYALQSYYSLRPHFHYKKDTFQKAVQDFQSIEEHPWIPVNEEERLLISKILTHWKLHGDAEANQYSHLILEQEGHHPKLIARNTDVAEDTLAYCKVIHLPSLQEQLLHSHRKQEEDTRMKNRLVVLSLAGIVVGISSQFT